MSLIVCPKKIVIGPPPYEHNARLVIVPYEIRHNVVNWITQYRLQSSAPRGYPIIASRLGRRDACKRKHGTEDGRFVDCNTMRDACRCRSRHFSWWSSDYAKIRSILKAAGSPAKKARLPRSGALRLVARSNMRAPWRISPTKALRRSEDVILAPWRPRSIHRLLGPSAGPWAGVANKGWFGFFRHASQRCLEGRHILCPQVTGPSHRSL